ncbi:MAG: helix-turn-helix transcriptional regulator [Acidobacteria bacterium]|nr:helix-turn-helix transcriptional regulator [Acidobacteriota bacterium]
MQPTAAVEVGALDSRAPREKIRFWRASTLPGLELMVAQHSGRIWRTIPDTYTFCVVPPSRGGNTPTSCASWRYRHSEFTYRVGVVSAEEPGEPHVNTRVSGALNFWVAFLDPSLLCDAASELGGAAVPHLRVALTADPALLAAFCRFYDALRHGAPVLEQESRLAVCLRLILETCAERAPARPPAGVHPGVRRAREYLEAHVAEPVRLADLAAVSRLSRFHFAHVFTRTYGISAHAYQTQLRAAAARRALRAGVEPRAIDVGFFDQSHLGKHFNRCWGVTPVQYAKASSVSTLPRMTN